MNEHAYPDALPAQFRLHWYVIERVLGQGGFGITYLARDTNLDQSVAIKEYLPTDVATRRPDSTVRPRTDDQGERYRWGLDRFIREARTLARFDHPNIVRVHSVFEFNNTAYMVMRFEEGETLAALLERRRTLPEADLVRVLLPILDGLELVHEAGFIHRDIKPDNIHLRSDRTPVLLDFGSARNALGHTRTVTILVAPGYAPFEQYHSSGESQGPWTDIYGLGATCYRAIAGIAPMDAIARSKGILGSTREILVPASAIGSGRYSPRLLKAIDHALEFAEKERPQSIAAWRKELAGEEPVPSVAGHPVPPADERRPGASAPVLRLIAGAVAAGAIAVAVVLWLRPAADLKRLDELERREQQRQREDETRRQREEEGARQKQAEEERQRQQELQRQENAQKDFERGRQQEQDQQAQKKPESKKREPPAAPKSAAKPEPPKSAVPVPDTAPTAIVVEQPLRTPEPPPSSAAPVRAAPKDDADAFRVYRDDALKGDAAAQLRLGEAYESGRGVVRNDYLAYVWYSAGARSGNAAAKAKKEQLASRLQPAEIRQAEKLVETLARPSR